jgi:hypothetical protein
MSSPAQNTLKTVFLIKNLNGKLYFRILFVKEINSFYYFLIL